MTGTDPHTCPTPRLADGERWRCPTCRRVWHNAGAGSLGEMAPRSQRIRHETRGVTQ